MAIVKSSVCVFLVSYVSGVAAFTLPDMRTASKMVNGVSLDEQQTAGAEADNSIDADNYYIGGGDIFLISVVESPSIRYTGTVNENCDVYISELGIIKIGTTSLTNAKKTIADTVSRKLKSTFEIYVSLIKTKTASVTVSGTIFSPGSYKLPGNARLLDLIKTANNNTVPSLTDFNFREVECRNKDSVRVYDLYKFLFKNDLSQNPYVYPGDNVFLPITSRRVLFTGAVRAPVLGNVPIPRNETAADFLSLFVLDASADSTHILIQRTNSDNTVVSKVFSLVQPEPFILKDNDIVIVSKKENYPSTLTVSVKGEVMRDGFFPIAKNLTKADDIIKMAGGTTPSANIARVYVVRRKKMMAEEIKQSYNNIKPLMSNGFLDNSVRPEINSGFLRMNSTNDFSILKFSDHNNGIVLEDGDEVVVPKKEYCVYVSGSVRHPGAYDFVPGKNPGYFIGLAGGYSSKADRPNMFVVTYYGVVVQVKENGALEEGDVIVVPDSQQYKFLAMVFIPILSAIAITVSTILALYTSIGK
jgi:protein involved in polysaccharide export with SLBB domain